LVNVALFARRAFSVPYATWKYPLGAGTLTDLVEGWRLIITIDGPPASGKSTAARRLAEALGFEYVDTGAMYRAATWRAMRLGIDMDDPEEVARAAAEADIRFVDSEKGRRVICDGQNVTQAIRSSEVTANIFRVADQPAARRALIRQQRNMARGRNVVAEGRDQGTVVFPDAGIKFYLQASLEERTCRRREDLAAAGEDVPEDVVRRRLRARDRQDGTRPMGALRRTHDMIVIDNTGLTSDETLARMTDVIAERFPELLSGPDPGRGAGKGSARRSGGRAE